MSSFFFDQAFKKIVPYFDRITPDTEFSQQEIKFLKRIYGSAKKLKNRFITTKEFKMLGNMLGLIFVCIALKKHIKNMDTGLNSQYLERKRTFLKKIHNGELFIKDFCPILLWRLDILEGMQKK
jgi:hypothetical protein